MSKRTNFCLTVASLALLATAAVRAESLEDVEKKLAEQSKKITSMSMKMKSVTDVSGEGFKSRSTLDATYEYMMDGKKMLSRTDSALRTQTEAGGAKQDSDGKSISLNDGEYTWLLSEQAGQKSVMKMRSDDKQTPNWREDLKEQYNTKLLPDETVDGKPCYVLEFTSKHPTPNDPTSRTTQYFQKDNGVMLKALVYGPDNKIMTTTTYSDIKINPSLDKSRFKFTPPPGAEVVDMTNVPGISPPAGGKK